MTLLTSGQFYVEIYTVAGVFVQGPLYNITRFRYDDVMDALSSWEMDMPLGDPYPRIAIQQHHRIVVTRLDDGALTGVYSGIVDSVYVDTKTNIIKIKGFCRGRELCWAPAGALDIWAEEVQAFDSALWDCYAGRQNDAGGGSSTELTGGGGSGFPWAATTLKGPGTSGAAISKWLYLGRDRLWHDLHVHMTTYNTKVLTAQWQYYNGQTGGWANLAVTDGTVSAGKPFGQDGDVLFVYPDDRVTLTHDGHNYYWIRVRVTQDDETTNIVISSCTGKAIIPTATPFATFITPILPAGWTLTGVGEPATPVFAQFTQESIFEVLVKIAEQTGEHFIINGTDIDWIGTTPLTGATQRYLEQTEDIDDEMSAVVLDAAFTKETYDLISRVYPYGGGHSSAQVTLAKATDTPPVGYTLVVGSNYVKYDAAEAPADPGYIGIIAKRLYCPEIGVETVEPPKDEHAANALLSKAVAYLSRRCAINTSYDVSVAGLTSRLYPGQRVQVTFSKYYQGTQYIDIDEVLIVVKFSEELSAEGIKHTITVSTTDMLAKTDAEKVSEYIEADYITKAHPQTVQAKNLATTKGTNASVFANGMGGMVLRDSALGSSGGSFTPAPHDILSTSHGDTLADTVVRGDLVVGNVTPKWARLAAGTIGQVLVMGATDPGWAAPAPAGVHAVLSATHTDTLADGVIRGDLMVGNVTPKWARLAAGALNTILAMGATDPAWTVLSTIETDPVFLARATDTGHYTGFPNKTDVDTPTFLAWVDGTLTLTLDHDPALTHFHIYINGTEYTITDPLAETIADATGQYWFWIELVVGVPTLTSGAFPGFDKCLVAIVYWNTVINKGILFDERHWMGRDQWYHEYLHDTVSARYASGMAGAFTSTTFQVDGGEFHDEDLSFVFGNQTTCKVLFKNGDPDFEWNTASVTPYKLNGTALRYNNANALADVSTGEFVAMWVFATPDTTHPIHVIIGQRVDANIANCRDNALPNTISFGTSMPTPEMKLLYRVIFRQNVASVTYMETADYRNVTNMPVTNYTATDHSALSNLLFSVSGHVLVAADLPAHAHTSAGTGGDYAWADITGFAAPANKVALTAAAEGNATTVLRSNVVLELDVSIAPTWTGAHIFKKAADSATGWQVQDQLGSVILNVDSINERVGVGTATPIQRLHTKGITVMEGGGVDGATGDQLLLYASGYPTGWLHTIKSSHSTTVADNILTFNLATGQSTSVDVLTLRGSGNVGVGTAAPRGRLHGLGSNSVGYFAHFDATGITATPVTLIPDGAGDCANVLCVLYTIKSTAASSNAYGGHTAGIIPGGHTVLGSADADGNEWSIAVDANGAITVYRSTTGGTQRTASVSIWALWI